MKITNDVVDQDRPNTKHRLYIHLSLNSLLFHVVSYQV